MNEKTIETNDRGVAKRVYAGAPRREQRVEDSIALAIAQGRIAKSSASHWRQRLMSNYDAAIETLAKIPTTSGDDAAYIDYARQSGILRPGMDPADLPSVRGW